MAERLVFVSYGLLTDEERTLGNQVAGIIRDHGMRPFIAQEVHSASDLNSNVFEAVRMCDAFLGILQKRGTVNFRDYPRSERSSVWIQQEFAMLCYRAFIEQRSIPMRISSERDIRREGVMEIAMANPIEFDHPAAILADVEKWLSGPDFAEHPVLATREEMFRRRWSETAGEQKLLLGLIEAHCLNPDDSVDYQLVLDDFLAKLTTQGLPISAARTRFETAYAAVILRGLIGRHDDSGRVRVGIAKQWWTLLLEEFRRQGRRL